MGITTIGLMDTNSDPDMVDIAIPGNDDAMRTIELVLKELAEAVEHGKAARPSQDEKAAPKRASSRGATMARADGSDVPVIEDKSPAAAPQAPAEG